MMRVHWLGGVALLALACEASEPEGTGTSEGSTSAVGTTTAGTSDTPTTPTTDALSSTGAMADSSSSGGPTGPIPAHGISIDWVEANQAVGVRIGDDGAGVGPEDRTARLIANRIALVRAFWTIDNDWEAREIEAHFTVNYPDGTSDTKIDRKLIEDDAFIGNLSQSFFWGLMEDESQPGITYHIELFETDPAFADPAVTEPPRLPEDGSEAFVGIEDSYQLLKIVLVPFNYRGDPDCVTEPDTSKETMQLFRDYMYMMMPVDRLDITIHDNIDWEEPLEGFVPLNQYMAGLRVEENAADEVFYYGIVDVCSGSLGGFGGLANGIPSDPTDPALAYQRVSSGLSLPNNPEFSADTFVHEVGHSLGRRHVACNGEEGGPDPTYPIEGGDLGEWGFGVLDFQLRHPTVYKDYMTYCNPAWVSTWGWNKVFPTIEVLSTWDADFPGGGAVAPSDDGALQQGHVLVGFVLESGEESWFVTRGHVDSTTPSATTSIEFSTASGSTKQAATVADLPDVDGRMITVAVPEDFDAVRSVRRLEGSKAHSIDRDRLKIPRKAH